MLSLSRVLGHLARGCLGSGPTAPSLFRCVSPAKRAPPNQVIPCMNVVSNIPDDETKSSGRMDQLAFEPKKLLVAIMLSCVLAGKTPSISWAVVVGSHAGKA